MTTITTKYPFVGSIDTRQGGRSENQDNAGFVDTPLGLLLVVCDGMGGGPGGRTASLMAVDTILNVLSDVSEHTPRENALKFAIEKANDIIYAKAIETPELRGMGTTVAAILINEDSAVIAHAGDTRIYQLRKGTIIFRSSDHSVVANLVRQKKITEEEARNHPQSNIVTRALGIRPNMEIEFDEVTFQRGDRFVLCSDGIWGMLPQRDLVKSLSRVMGISELTSAVVEEIDRIGQSNGGGHDNLTLAVVDTSFDSVLKKFKKKKSTDDSVNSDEKDSQGTQKRNFLMILFAGGLIFAIILSAFLYPNPPDNKSGYEQIYRPLKGTASTTTDSNIVEIRKDDSDSQYPYSVDSQINQVPQKYIGNPFQDTTIRDEEHREISRQINNVVKNLDNLKKKKIKKKIKEKNQKKTIKKKKKHVRNVITPNVNRLGYEVVNEKKNIKDIIVMLKDKKTVSCDKHGLTTREGIIHIEKIKKLIRELQD